MKQHVAHEQVAAVRYTDGIDRAWATWEPSLRRLERVFGSHAWRAGLDGDELAAKLRRAQYRAHATSEFASGLVPPQSVLDAHEHLVASLVACRDALGVLAVRAELDELDDESAELGLQAVDATRDAFHGAHSCTMLVHAWVAEDQVDPEWLHEPARPARTWPWVLWMLVATSGALFVALVAQAIMGAGNA